jgi:hypothetical protein
MRLTDDQLAQIEKWAGDLGYTIKFLDPCAVGNTRRVKFHLSWRIGGVGFSDTFETRVKAGKLELPTTEAMNQIYGWVY